MSVQAKRWTREEYDRMVALGVLTPESRVQLIDGEILEMTPQGARHATAIRLVERALRRVFGEDAFDVRGQLPLALGPHSEPEPDIAVVQGSLADYRDRHPESAVLVVEVADESLHLDRNKKVPLYASAGIPEYWILNLEERILEVYRGPEAGGYREHLRLRQGESVTPPARPEARIEVGTLLP